MAIVSDERPGSIAAEIAAYGADLRRWPDPVSAGQVREALLHDRELRRAWRLEGQLDRALAATRLALDQDILASGAMERLDRRLARVPARVPAGLQWRRIAAAVLVAMVLGGTADLALVAEPLTGPSETVSLDNLLFGPDTAEL